MMVSKALRLHPASSTYGSVGIAATVSSILHCLQSLPSFVSAQVSSSSSSSSSSSTGTSTTSSSSDDSVNNVIYIIIICILGVAILFISRNLYRLYKNDHADRSVSQVGTATGEGDEANKRNWKIDYFDLEMGDMVGKGTSGKVFKARWRGLTVAVKELTLSNTKEETVQTELAQVIRVRHPFLVLFMGVAQPSPEKICVVSEYMAKGSLFSVLHDRSQKLDWRRRCNMALESARAMNYLHQNKPPLLHKSLSSINILIDKELVAKVSDYGLDNLRGAARKNGMIQPLWIAPEVFKKNKYSMASDVYSFGIILWELVTRKTPYGGKINANNLKAIKDITAGTLRPDIPSDCPPPMAALIRKCWDSDSAKRPTFQAIVDELGELEKLKVDVNAWHSELEVKVENPEVETKLEGKDRKPWMVNWDEIKLEEVIGHGSFGEVWVGMFRGKKVAVKLLNKGAISKSHLKEFVHELNIMCSLRHPNTVLFMGACLEEGHMCLIMEYCEKGNLFEILHDVSQPIDYNQIIKILLLVAEGVYYLHSNTPPILHRDLKSLNILVDADWNIKVSDFGLTDFKPDVDKPHNLQLGTPFWMAPEAMEHQEFSEASDVYSFGMIIWEMFTRQVPFPNMNPHQAALAVIEDKRPEIPAFVPPNFADLIQRCWQRDAKSRPSFPKILEALKRLKDEGLPRLDLDHKNAKLFRKKTTVFAFKSKDTVIVYKPWGTGEGKKGDWVLVGPNDDVYTCDAAIFLKTYVRVDTSRPHLFRKTGKIWAREMPRDFLMETLEGMEHGLKGDFLAQNPVDGEQWPIARKVFQSMYEIAPVQTLDDEPNGGAAAEAVPEEKKEKRISISHQGANGSAHTHNGSSVGIGLGLTPGAVGGGGGNGGGGGGGSSGERDEKRGRAPGSSHGDRKDQKEAKYDHLYDGHDMD